MYVTQWHFRILFRNINFTVLSVESEFELARALKMTFVDYPFYAAATEMKSANAKRKGRYRFFKKSNGQPIDDEH